MIGMPMRAQIGLWTFWAVRVALLMTPLALLLLSENGRAADPNPAVSPTPEEVARYLEWYKRQGTPKPPTAAPAVPPDEAETRFLEAFKHAGAPKPVTGENAAAVSEEVTRFLEGYSHNGASKPSTGTDATPSAEDIARFLEGYKRNGTVKTSTSPLTGTPNTPPSPEEVARILDWCKHNCAPRPLVPLTLPPSSPSPDEVARFLEWYKHNNAPKPITLPPETTPTREEIARFLETYKHNGAPVAVAVPKPTEPDEPPVKGDVARFVEIYRRSGAPTPHLAMGPDGQPLLPAAIPGEVQAIYDNEVQQVAVADEPRPVPPPPPRSMVARSAAPPVTEAPPKPFPATVAEPASEPQENPHVSPFEMILQQVGCSSCGNGGGLLGPRGPMDYGSGPPAGGAGCSCGSGGCVPGRHGCYPCEANTVVGRFLCGVYECICCPDPCYDPKWIPIADAAFFVESARPQTQQGIGWDAGRNLILPDRAEYFWARADGKGRGPDPANHANPNGLLGESRINYNDLWLYTEAALGNVGVFVYVPYRSLDGELVGHAAGFGDMNVGTKTLLFDCELLQIAFEFRTYIPVGNTTKGLGNGHVSLEPGLLLGVKICPDTYFQGQLAEWIPLGGDTDYEGAALEYRFSFNQLICRVLPDVPLIGTLEFEGISFQHGLYTDPFAGPGQRATGGAYLSFGPGLRLFVCDKIDFGLGTSFSLTERHFADELFRTEFRWRY